MLITTNFMLYYYGASYKFAPAERISIKLTIQLCQNLKLWESVRLFHGANRSNFQS